MSTAIVTKPEIVEDRSAPPAVVSESAAILSIIERAARDPAVDIDKMERLIAMQDRMIARQAKGAYAAALAQLQADLPSVARHGKIIIRDKNNSEKIIQQTPYALWEDINDAIKPHLKTHGFSLSFRSGREGDRVIVTGILSHRDGHSEETVVPLALDTTGSKNNVQSVGSSISYGKRYAAGLLLNLTSHGEDDDGQAAGGPALVTDEQAAEISRGLVETKSDLAAFLRHMKVESVSDIPAAGYEKAMQAIAAKRAKMAKDQEGGNDR